MAFNLFDAQGVPVEQQCFTWRDVVQKPISKLDDDAFTRVRIILMGGIESEALRFAHMAARCKQALRVPLAQVRRTEQQQASMLNGLIAPDHSPLETTIAYEQTAVELTAAIAQREPDPALAQTCRFTLLDDLDHLYRFAALLDRQEGKDANVILQSHTDVLPGRPSSEQHRSPRDAPCLSIATSQAALQTRLHALTMVATKYQARDYYMATAALFADPLARQLYAEIGAIEEQHLTQYACLLDPADSLIAQWVLHEANECYLYYSCLEQETNHQLRLIWDRFLDYELGHFHLACDALKSCERRDPAEIVGTEIGAPLQLHSQRAFVRKVLASEVGLRTDGARFVPREQEGNATLTYRNKINADGSPSDAVASGYIWMPGTELHRKGVVSAFGRGAS